MPKASLGCTKATVVPRLPGRGSFVDDTVAGRLHAGESLAAVSDPVADVVESFAALLQVLGDRRVVADRHEELHVRVGHLQQGLLDAVGLDDLAVTDVAAEGVAVVRDRRIEVVDRDRNVVDLRERAGSSHDTIVRPVSCAAGRA